MRIPTEQETLEFAHRLIDAGVPVVVCKPRPGGDDVVPIVSWKNLRDAEQCREHLSRFRYGRDALALIGGHGIDLVDVDAKADGVFDPFDGVRTYGVTRTPSGGTHHVITSTGMRKVTGLAVDGVAVGDYIGGTAEHGSRMLGFLPGSVRPKYGKEMYAFEEEWDVAAAVLADPDPRAVALLAAAGADEPEERPYFDYSPRRDPALGLHPYFAAARLSELRRLTDLPMPWHEGSYWDDTTFEVACTLVRFANSGWTGYTLAQAKADLFAHAPSDEAWGYREHEAKWASAVAAVGGAGREAPDDRVDDDFDDGWEDDAPPPESKARFEFRPGGAFVLDTPTEAVPVWGTGSEVLLAEGEALIVASMQGLGKTTLAQQFTLRRCGVVADDLLGHAVQVGTGRVLYLAMDRPKQAARSLRRMVTEEMRADLDDRLAVWEGPPPADLAVETGLLAEMCRAAGADTVVVDSLKDAALNLSEDGPGAAWNRARQTALQAGVQVLELHHNRKKQQGIRSAPGIDDVYGSTWITSGAGSVVLLTGEPGDLIVGLHHLKQPAEPVGPLQVLHDHGAGRSTVYHAADLVALANARQDGITARDAAEALFDTRDPSGNDKKKAERRLAALVRSGHLRVLQAGDAGSRTPTRWGR